MERPERRARTPRSLRPTSGHPSQNVGLDSLDFGDYEARDEPYQFNMPKAKVSVAHYMTRPQ